MKKTLYLLSFTLSIAFMVSCDKYETPEIITSIAYSAPEDTIIVVDGDTVIDLLAGFKADANVDFMNFQTAFTPDPTPSQDSILRITMLDSTHRRWAIYNSQFIDDYFASIVGATVPADSLVPKFTKDPDDPTWDTLIVIYPAFFQAFLSDIQVEMFDPGYAEEVFNGRCNEIIDIVMNRRCDEWVEEYF